MCLLYKMCCLGFNPRARDGRDKGKLLPWRTAAVSIHAPVMDAMVGADLLAVRFCSFNPRARDGRDGKVVTGVACLRFQSTRP